MEGQPAVFVRAMYAYNGAENACLTFAKDDIIEVITQLESGWWDGQIVPAQARGWFPSNYVVAASPEESAWAREQLEIEEAAVLAREEAERRASVNPRNGRGSVANGTSNRDTSLWAGFGVTGASGAGFGEGEDDDLTSFSTGGDIFAEIAAGAAAAASGTAAAHYAYDDELPTSQSRRTSGFDTTGSSSGAGSEGNNAAGDFWVPRVTPDGQIFYYNSRTGQTSRDMPTESSPSSTDQANQASARHATAPSFPASVAQSDSRDSASAASSQDRFDMRPARRMNSDDPTMRGGNLNLDIESLALHPAAMASDEALGNELTPAHHEADPRLSFYSDDSALDADMRPATKKAVAPTRPAAATIDTSSSRSTKAASSAPTAMVRNPLDDLDPTPLPTLATLETRVNDALAELIDAAHPRRKTEGTTTESAAGDTQDSSRERLAILTNQVVAEIRSLMQAADVLEPSSGTHPASISSARNSMASNNVTRWQPGGSTTTFSSPASLAAYQSEVRPFTRKITSTLSKLVLSVRAVWGLMGPSAEEEMSLQASFAELAAVEGEDDVDAQKANREDTLKARQDVETKLRWDVVDGAREVSDGVLKFVDEVERLSGGMTAQPSSQSRSSDRATMPTVKRPLAVLRLGASATLPGAGAGGNWRGNGFVGLPPSPPPSAGGYSNHSQAPSTPLNQQCLLALASDARSVSEEVANLRAIINAVVAKASKRISTASARSFGTSSSRPSTPGGTGHVPPIQPSQPTYTPLQSAARHLTKIGGNTTNLLSALSHYLAIAEDVDVAARLDFDLAPSIVPALQAALADEAKAKGKERSDITDEQVETFQRSLQRAQPMLNGLERAKQALYDASPALLLAVQAIGLSSTTENIAPSAAGASLNRSQPAADSPLTSFAAPARHPDPLAAIAASLDAIEMAVRFTTEAFNALFAIANEQDTFPVDLRRLAHQIRCQTLGRPSSSRTASGTMPATHTRGMPSLSGAYGGLRGLGLEDENATEDTQTEASSLDGDFFYPNRMNSNSTMQTSVGQRNSGSEPSAVGAGGWDTGAGRTRLRDSYPSSVASSAGRREAALANSMPRPLPAGAGPTMARGHTANSASLSNESEFGSPTMQPHSPSKSKLRKFFGDDAPPTNLGRANGAPGAARADVPFFLESDYDDELSWNAEGQVRGGTLRALVARLTSHDYAEHFYTMTFLMTYRTFTSSDELFDLLVARYFIRPPAELTPQQLQMWTEKKQNLVQLRTINVIKTWIEKYLFEGDADQILRRAADFGTRLGGRNAQQILKVVHTRRQFGPKTDQNSQPIGAPPAPIPLKNPKRIKFLDIDPLEMARQLTLMDSRLYQTIQPTECLSKAWPKQFGTETPNITAMTSLGNAITNWVVETVLRQEDLRRRANTIKQFVHIAERCRQLQNFSTLIHIVAGLYTTPIHRLRRTWETVQPKTMASLQELNSLMSPTRNFAEYREAIRTVGPPCVPFLGVFLTSWTFIGDGNSDHLRERPDHVNFNKRQKAAELIQQIQLHQNTPYNFVHVAPIQQYLDAAFNTDRDDQVFYSMSLQIEPKEREDDRIARLLSESGFL